MSKVKIIKVDKAIIIIATDEKGNKIAFDSEFVGK